MCVTRGAGDAVVRKDGRGLTEEALEVETCLEMNNGVALYVTTLLGLPQFLYIWQNDGLKVHREVHFETTMRKWVDILQKFHLAFIFFNRKKNNLIVQAGLFSPS